MLVGKDYVDESHLREVQAGVPGGRRHVFICPTVLVNIVYTCLWAPDFCTEQKNFPGTFVVMALNKDCECIV